MQMGDKFEGLLCIGSASLWRDRIRSEEDKGQTCHFETCSMASVFSRRTRSATLVFLERTPLCAINFLFVSLSELSGRAFSPKAPRTA